MNAYRCAACFGDQGGFCTQRVDGDLQDRTMCPVTFQQEAEWYNAPVSDQVPPAPPNLFERGKHGNQSDHAER